MTLEQLRVFVAVAERQHVTRAAEALDIAQSAAIASMPPQLLDRIPMHTDQPAFVTGTTLFADGGMTLYPHFATGSCLGSTRVSAKRQL